MTEWIKTSDRMMKNIFKKKYPALSVMENFLGGYINIGPLEDWGFSTPCPKCGQVDMGQTGEYPCDVCKLPQVWDDPAKWPTLSEGEE